MASYASYKKVLSSQIQANAVTDPKMAPGAGTTYGVAWVFNPRGFCCQHWASLGGCTEQANGRCCAWVVPTHTRKVTFEIWSGGGGGAGHTCCNCCSFSVGGGGGGYSSKTVCTFSGCTYTACAGGTWPCAKSHTCAASPGCRSYVNGQGLSNFCAEGGCGGWMCNGDAWGPRQLSPNCTGSCGINNWTNIISTGRAEMISIGTAGMKTGQTFCRCNGATSFTGAAFGIGKVMMTAVHEAWCSCGCYLNWPAGGGMSGTSSYCGNVAKCCAGGGQGGSGLVKITYW